MIVVYGKDPGSAVAMGMSKKLIELQYKRVRMYKGGLADWVASGQPVEK
jgi:rhodanese-related sulfurtransferase